MNPIKLFFQKTGVEQKNLTHKTVSEKLKHLETTVNSLSGVIEQKEIYFNPSSHQFKSYSGIVGSFYKVFKKPSILTSYDSFIEANREIQQEVECVEEYFALGEIDAQEIIPILESLGNITKKYRELCQKSAVKSPLIFQQNIFREMTEDDPSSLLSHWIDQFERGELTIEDVRSLPESTEEESTLKRHLIALCLGGTRNRPGLFEDIIDQFDAIERLNREADIWKLALKDAGSDEDVEGTIVELAEKLKDAPDQVKGYVIKALLSNCVINSYTRPERNKFVLIAKHFKEFKINDPDLRYEIAKEFYSSNNSNILYIHLEKFEIEQPKQLTSLVLIMAECKSQYLIGSPDKFFNKFKIDDKGRVKVAWMIAEADLLLAIKFQLYGIKDPEARHQLLLHLLDNSPNFASHFKTYAIKEEEERFILAQKLCEKRGVKALKYFAQYEIYDPDKQLDLLNIVAANATQESEWGEIVATLNYCELSSQQTHSLLLKIADDIDKIKIASEAYHFINRRADTKFYKILESILSSVPSIPQLNVEILPEIEFVLEAMEPIIDSYEKELIDLKEKEKALLPVVEKSRVAIHELKTEILKIREELKDQPGNSDFSDQLKKKQRELKEINQSAAELGRVRTAITKHSNNLEAFAKARHGTEIIHTFFQINPEIRLSVKDVAEVLRSMKTLLRLSKDDRASTARREIEKLIKGVDILAPLYKAIDQLKTSQRAEMPWLWTFLFYSSMSMALHPELLQEPAFSKIFAQFTRLPWDNIIGRVREEPKFILSEELFRHLDESPSDKAKHSFLQSVTIPNYASLPKLALFVLHKKKGAFEDKALIMSLNKRKGFLRDDQKLILIVEVFLALSQSSLDDKAISNWLLYASNLNDRDFLFELEGIKMILNQGKEEDFIASAAEGSHRSARDFIIKSGYTMLKEQGVKIGDEHQFERLFLGERSPGSLFLYLFNIQSLNKDEYQEVLNEIKRFIDQVDQDTFKEERYLGSEHLNQVFHGRRNLEKEWKKGGEVPLSRYCPDDPNAEKGWLIVDSDDPLDLLNSGYEVAGSCQSVTAFPKHCKALMSYVMDGKHRILAMKNEKGEIVGRAVLRLMVADSKEKPSEFHPVLFFESIYPTNLKSEYQEALIEVAKERAGLMELPLYSRKFTSDHVMDRPIRSLGSKTKYEYCDGAGGAVYGPYEIPKSYRLN